MKSCVCHYMCRKCNFCGVSESTQPFALHRVQRQSTRPKMDKVLRTKMALVLLFVQCLFVVWISFFGEYAPSANASNQRNSISSTFGGFTQKVLTSEYGLFQDVHVMIFVGFGLLMAFLKRYGYSSIGFNFMLASLISQWALLCQCMNWQRFQISKLEVGLMRLIDADIAAATVLISMGAVLGRTTYMQLIVMGMLEVIAYMANANLGRNVLQVVDAGGSIFVHLFGAYFGLATSFTLGRRSRINMHPAPLECSSYYSDIFSMIGTLFLWVYWPSFNAIGLVGDDQQRAVVNTYLALSSSCVTTMALSVITNAQHYISMMHVQNATLAGGVAIGAVANLMVQPFGAILIGFAAAVLSVIGYSYLLVRFRQSLYIRDTCGVHNLHGLPGLFSGLLSILMAALASEKTYDMSLYDIYPARSPMNLTATAEYTFLKTGQGRSAIQQAGYQLLAVTLTLVIAITSGLLTGFIISIWPPYLKENEWYSDDIFWERAATDSVP